MVSRRAASFAFAYAGLVLAALLAGCAADTDASLAGTDIRFDENTGGIRGIVLDESELPVAGATVELIGIQTGAPTAVTTDEAGQFRIGYVPPGERVLLVTAPGHEPVEHTVQVEAGQIADDVLITLSAIPSDQPYSITIPHRRTISGAVWKLTPDCMYLRDAPGADTFYGTPAWNVLNATKTCTGGTLRCEGGDPCSQWNFNETLTENPNWRTIVFEGTWVPTSATTGRSFYIDLAAPGYRDGSYVFTDPEVWYDMDNKPPIVIRADNPDELVERGLPEAQWCCAWVARLFPAQCDLGNCFERSGPDIGLMVDQSIDLYQSFSFHEPFDPDYTARPEA